jgi:hypothetical protein
MRTRRSWTLAEEGFVVLAALPLTPLRRVAPPEGRLFSIRTWKQQPARRRDRSRATIAVCHSILTAASTTERYMHAKARPDDHAPP